MVYTENTPNPNAIKFISEKTFSKIEVAEFHKRDIKKIKNNFIKNLLEFEGVELVLISEKFISVKKTEKVNWDSLKPSIISLINDYFQKNNKPILSEKNEENSEKKNIRENVLNSWLEEFDWLEYNDLHYYFKCNHCDTKFESNNAKKSVFNNHQKSKKHIQNSCVLEIT